MDGAGQAIEGKAGAVGLLGLAGQRVNRASGHGMGGKGKGRRNIRLKIIDQNVNSQIMFW